MDEAKQTSKAKSKEPTFTKEQILKSEKYKDRKDILNVILNDDSFYTIKEIDSAIDRFMKREVK